MTDLQAYLIAIIQGATELFPISSLGHAVVLPAVLHWGIDQRSVDFLPFLVLLHTGTALALLVYFWRDWLALGLGVVGAGPADKVRESRHLLLLIVVATIPAVILGYGLNKFLKELFASPLIAAAFLVLNGFMLLVGEQLRTRPGADRIDKRLGLMTMSDALIIGLWQCLALLPGLSRAGATMVGGLLRGFDHERSARFSFLIALPIIVGATALEVPHLMRAGIAPGVLQTSIVAAILAGITAWLATAFLMRYFRDHDAWALKPFAMYCIVVGAAAAGWLVLA